jgi:hypothetical protein
MAMVALDGGQTPTLFKVHLNTLTPRARFVTEAMARLVGLIIPDPDISDHDGIPVVNAEAANAAVGVLIQMVWLEPAFAMLVTGSTIMVAVTLLFGQLLPIDPITY